MPKDFCATEQYRYLNNTTPGTSKILLSDIPNFTFRSACSANILKVKFTVFDKKKEEIFDIRRR